MKKIIFILLTFMAGFGTATAAETAQQVLDRAIVRLRGASGVSAQFTLSQGKQSVTGQLRTKGRKFSIVSASAGAWYNGASLTTWSKQTGDATITTPTAAELRETNPLLFLDSASDFSASFLKAANASQKVIKLTPKKRGAPAKDITVTLNAASLTPSRIAITLPDGGKMNVSLRNVTLKANVSDTEFNFPQKRYPKAKITDLR